MSELIKEELLGTVRKKRFIILIALAYISAVIFVFYRKGDFWTDLTYLSAIDGYLFCVFNALAGSILILSAYLKKYTRLRKRAPKDTKESSRDSSPDQ